MIGGRGSRKGSLEEGDNQIRGRTRAIATTVKKLCGTPLYTSVAKLVSVGIQVDVTKEDVVNWSKW